MFSSQFGDRSDAQNMVIIITDGESNSPSETIQEANLARESGNYFWISTNSHQTRHCIHPLKYYSFVRSKMYCLLTFPKYTLVQSFLYSIHGQHLIQKAMTKTLTNLRSS